MHILRVDYLISGPSLAPSSIPGPVIARRSVSIMLRRAAHPTTDAQLHRALVREVANGMRQVLREERARRKAKSK